MYDKASRLGHAARFLALLGIAVQLFAPVAVLRPLASPAGDAFAALFDANLICHGADTDRQPKSGQPSGPPPHRATHALCCFWHGNASPVVPTPIVVAPAPFSGAEIVFAAPAAFFLPARPQGDVRTRAPPTGLEARSI